MKPKKFEITADAGFLGLVNPSLYKAFVGEDGDFEQIKQRIIQESNKGHLLFWGTEVPNTWTVRVCTEPIAAQEVRSIEGKIKVSHSNLYLLNYEALSEAAQFHDEDLANSDYLISLENGVYDVLIRQLLNPEKDTITEEALGFELVLQKSTSPASEILNQFSSLIWSKY